MKVVVYDLETCASCFTYTDIDVKTKEINQFVLHKDKNQLTEFIEYLNNGEIKGMIGFNNINFDYPLIHKFFLQYNKNRKVRIEDFIYFIYEEAGNIIEKQNKDNFFEIVAIKQSEVIIPQLDLFKLWHYNNKARKTSLKSLEISMNLDNVQDMPIDYKRTDISLEEIDTILSYNLNDVLATYEFYLKSVDKIELRKKLNKLYDLNCINFSDSKIGESLILKLYCQKTNQDWYDVKKMKTERNEIIIKDCIFDYIKFQTDDFNNLLNYYKSKVIQNTKNSISQSVIFKGFKYDFGSGGIHGCIKSGVYEKTDETLIIDIDVASLYPSIAIVNKLYPEHLGNIFCDIYENDIIKPRLIAKKQGDKVLSDGFKLAANSVYGKSNDDHSFLKDPKYTITTTINGQLMLAMLSEDIVLKIKNVTLLQINTDGLTIIINQKDKDLLFDICKEWEQITKLTLEYDYYKKVVIADVNNYFGIYENKDKKPKYKGRFEIDKVVGSEPAYHKDNSFRIIPIAISQYFKYAIPIENTIKFHFENEYQDFNNYGIYDFCGRQKFGKDSYGEITFLDSNKDLIKERLGKNVRYYISNNGARFIKYYNKGASEVIEKGYSVTLFNKYEKKTFQDYNIDLTYYIKKANQEINQILNNNQLNLFNF